MVLLTGIRGLWWRVGETVNSLAFHASIHGFESRTRHHLTHISHIYLCEFLFIVCKIHTLFGYFIFIFAECAFFMCLRTGWGNTWFPYFTFLNIQNKPYDVTKAHSSCCWRNISLLRCSLYLITRSWLNGTTMPSTS